MAEAKAQKRWERPGLSAFRAAGRVLAEPALTGDALLLKIHVAGFKSDTKRGTGSAEGKAHVEDITL